MRYMTYAQLKALHGATVAKAASAREPIRQQLSHIHSLAGTNEVRVISYGLYGKSPRYTIGVLRNAQLAPLVYPGWKVRVYLDSSVPRNVVEELERSRHAHASIPTRPCPHVHAHASMPTRPLAPDAYVPPRSTGSRISRFASTACSPSRPGTRPAAPTAPLGPAVASGPR